MLMPRPILLPIQWQSISYQVPHFEHTDTVLHLAGPQYTRFIVNTNKTLGLIISIQTSNESYLKLFRTNNGITTVHTVAILAL